jgi:RimJ/RimL family protein N-acetyltransferase
MPEIPLPDPGLADEAIRLRPWSEADLEAVKQAAGDPLISRYTRVPRYETVDDVKRSFDSHDAIRKAGDTLHLAIADARADHFLGSVLLNRFDWTDRRAEVGYWLARWARGRGVATRAVRMLSRWAVLQLGLTRVALYTDTENEASQRLAERSGFIREGVLRSFEERDGRRCDLVVFSLVVADLQ